MMYNLVELFNTIQGEGSTQGLPVTLIRFPNCQLKCPFCDSQKIMAKPLISASLKNIYELSNTSRNLLITGGEPTLYNNDIIDIVYNLYTNTNAQLPYNVIVETNGAKLLDLIEKVKTIEPLNRITNYVFSHSPKMYNATTQDFSFGLLKKLALHDNVELKIVIDPNNFEVERNYIETAFSVGIPKKRIWLMPLGAQYEELMSNLYPVVQLCHQMGVNLSPRLHIVFGKNLDLYLNKDLVI